MAYFNNSNKPFLCERNKEKVFSKTKKWNLLFSGGEKSSKKAAGTLATVSQTPQRFKGRKCNNSRVVG